MSRGQFDYDLAGIAASIEKLEAEGMTLENENVKFRHDLEERLVPNWDTTGGKVMIPKLESFSDNEIKNMINFIQQKTSDLRRVQANTQSIDQL